VGFLRPVPMVKVSLLALKEDRERLVALLHDLGVLQVEPLRKEAAQLLEPEHGGEPQRRVSEGLLRFRTLKAALPTTPTGTPESYADLQSVLRAAASVSIDAEVMELKREEDRLVTDQRQAADTRRLLEQHRYYREPLRLLRSGRMYAFFGEATQEAFGHLRENVGRIAEAAFVPSLAERSVRFLLAVPREQADAVGRLAQQTGVRLTAVPALDGTIEEELPRLAAEEARLAQRLTEVRRRLNELAQRWYPIVAALEEAFTIENRKFEAWTRMGAGRSTFALEGWVPARSLPALQAALVERVGERAELLVIPSTEEPPTLMDNPPGIQWFEFFIRFYALPKAREFDPTWIFAIAFPIFFGFMLGDVGYGAVILTISLWMIAGFPGGGRLPKSLRSFLTMIMGPKGMQLLARTLLPGCVLAIALGVLSNEYFGAHLPFYTALFDPVSSVGKLLVIAGYIGLTMVTVGFALGAIKAYYLHHRGELYARVGGILFAWGVAGAGLSVLHRQFNLSAPGPELFLGLIVSGLGLLLLGEGGQGLMALTEIVSHILSYTRLVGILLSSVILALVINSVSHNLFFNSAPSIGLHLGYIFFGVVILFVGQIFNLVLGVFEPGIQGARLIFVEHFSKFYEGNGRPFRPFGSRRTFTSPTSERSRVPFLEGAQGG
jgi:V/A-type H+-transporting ATPase subunit I